MLTGSSLILQHIGKLLHYKTDVFEMLLFAILVMLVMLKM